MSRPYCYHFDSGALYRYFYEPTIWRRPRGAWWALLVNLRRRV